MGFIILWVCLSYLLGYYHIEHNILAAFCVTLIVAFSTGGCK